MGITLGIERVEALRGAALQLAGSTSVGEVANCMVLHVRVHGNLMGGVWRFAGCGLGWGDVVGEERGDVGGRGRRGEGVMGLTMAASEVGIRVGSGVLAVGGRGFWC